MSHQLDIIRRAGRMANQFVESEHGGRAADGGDVDIAAPDLLRLRVRRIFVGAAEEAEPFLGVGAGVRVEG